MIIVLVVEVISFSRFVSVAGVRLVVALRGVVAAGVLVPKHFLNALNGI